MYVYAYACIYIYTSVYACTKIGVHTYMKRLRMHHESRKPYFARPQLFWQHNKERSLGKSLKP